MTYGLIGERLSHSFSKTIHAMLGNAEYKLKSLQPSELEGFLKAGGFSGLNVTIPYKKAVIPYCKQLSKQAQRIGSVNTIINKNGELFGDNTDYGGFLYMARRAGISFKGEKVLILGSGGTSLTAQTAAADSGAAEVVVVSRGGKVNYENILDHSDATVIVNTTPVGMYPNNGAKPVELRDFPSCKGVLDVIYNPLRSALVLDAAEAGIAVTGGLPMLVYQAKLAHELFFNCRVSDETAEEIIKKLEARMSNIVLVGMPGSGKSTVGKLVARGLSRDFIDVDSEIEAAEGMTIPEIFEKLGESRFREIESRELEKACCQTGKVIATGGGAVLLESNRRAIKQNGFAVWLKRDVNKLETRGRPLSSPDTLQEMYRLREPFYMAAADLQLDCNRKADQCAEDIMEVFK